MKIERANVRRDCTVGLPPNVVEELGLVCGKSAVDFVIYEEGDRLEDMQKTIEKHAKGTVIVLTGSSGGSWTRL